MSSSEGESSSEDSDSYSDSSDSCEEELMEIERRDNNPFNFMQGCIKFLILLFSGGGGFFSLVG